MPDNPKLARTIFTQYRDNFGLFWRIMAPFAVITIVLNGALFLRVSLFRDDFIGDKLSKDEYKVTSSVGTIRGVGSRLLMAVTETSGDATVTVMRDPLHPTGVHKLLFPFPYYSSTNDQGITWIWRFSFRDLSYSPLNFLLLSLFPLSVVVINISRGSAGVLTARDAWRLTGQKALKVWCVCLLFVLVVFWINSADRALRELIFWLMLPPRSVLPVELLEILVSGSVYLFTGLQLYFMVTFSLCNPCLVLENRSIIGTFRRSYALVRGARWRFLGIYMLTGWLASVMASVLLGLVLLIFSAFIPHLAPIRDALSPVTFLSLFIGGEVQVLLSEVLGVPATVTILIFNGLIATFLVPIWAILTTHLYFQRVDANKEVA